MPDASIILPTRNRRDLLRRAIVSSFAQSVAVEVIVLDDGSTDGTGDMVRAEFPQVKLLSFNGANGPALLRNRGAQAAGCEYLFPIDDDAEFVSPRTVEQTIAELSAERIGAVGIPYVNVASSDQVLQQAPDAEAVWITSAFVGAAHAVRKSAFQAVGGYREHLYYMGEEGDLCLRLLANGWLTCLGHADPMHHHQSPIRNHQWADLYGRRNDVLFQWHNAPWVELPWRLARTTAGGMIWGVREKRLWTMLRGLGWGYGSALRYLGQRQPVSRSIWSIFRKLAVSGPLQIEQVLRDLNRAQQR